MTDIEQIEQYRPGFEAWASEKTDAFSKALLWRDNSGCYLNRTIEAQWKSWTAAKRESGSGSGTSTSQGDLRQTQAETGAAPGDALDAARLGYVLAHGRPMKWFDNDDRNVWRYMHINEWSNSAIEAIDKARSAIAASTKKGDA